MTKWLHGESVEVKRRIKVGEDELAEPIYEWGSETVDNVLVTPIYSESSNVDELSDTNRPDGISIRYRLSFPKSYDKDLTHCKIILTERGMSEDDALTVVGMPDKFDPCPTEWNKIVVAVRTDG